MVQELIGFGGAWGEAIKDSVLNQLVGAGARAITKTLPGKVKTLVTGPEYQQQNHKYHQVHLPKPMAYRRRSYGRRYRRRSRRVVRRRYGRKRVSRYGGRRSAITTAQHDVHSTYRSRRGGARSFVRRVQNALVMLQPVGLYTFQKSTTTTGTADQNTYVSVIIGGMTVSNNDELFQAMNSCYAAIAGTIANANKYEIYIRNYVCDIQLTNASSFPISVDVYTLMCRRAYQTNASIDSQFVTALGEIGADATGGSVVSTRPTLTPFDAPNFCEFWKVLNKRTTILQAGNFIQMQQKLRRTKKIEGKLYTSCPQALPYYSMGYLFCIRGSPQNVTGGQLGAPTVVLSRQWNVHMCGPPGNQSEFGKTA